MSTAVVTGVTSGIGEALTQLLLCRGATVAGIGRDTDRLARAADRWGARFHPIVADLADPGERSGCVTEILRVLPRADLLVNNAAECVYQTPLDLGYDRLRSLLEVNVLASVDLIRGLLPALEGGGHVVNISSVVARNCPDPRYGSYALTKAALDHVTSSLRPELDRHGVKVTLVVPGLVATPIYDKVDGFERARERLLQRIPQWLTAADVAEAVLWAFRQPSHVVVSEIVLLPRGQSS